MKVNVQYSIKKAAEIMKVSEWKVRQWIDRGELRSSADYYIPTWMSNGEVFILKDDLEHFMDTHRGYLGDAQTARVIKVETTFQFLPDEFGDDGLDRILAKYKKFVEEDLF